MGCHYRMSKTRYNEFLYFYLLLPGNGRLPVTQWYFKKFQSQGASTQKWTSMHSSTNDRLFSVKIKKGSDFIDDFSIPYYCIMLFRGKANFLVDFVEYRSHGNTVLFLSPHQNFKWQGAGGIPIRLLTFHGDFYCIEYHKKEVACNGLLFNNIYLTPQISISDTYFEEIGQIVQKMKLENESGNPYSNAVLKSYLQLILALSSREKSILLGQKKLDRIESKNITVFQELIEKHYIRERSPAFYASELKLSPSTFSKNIKKQIGKTPTQLIQERVILESKKLLHLTHKSIKEIAMDLHFEDEYYFSRYFKKNVGLSPMHYRKDVGISIVAK